MLRVSCIQVRICLFLSESNVYSKKSCVYIPLFCKYVNIFTVLCCKPLSSRLRLTLHQNFFPHFLSFLYYYSFLFYDSVEVWRFWNVQRDSGCVCVHDGCDWNCKMEIRKELFLLDLIGFRLWVTVEERTSGDC
jgi:hypothetical protein